jgi:hypothetical protein
MDLEDFVELLAIDDRFQLGGIGLTIVPDFPVPKGWRNLEEQILIITPDGGQFETLARFNTAHFNIRDPEASPDRRWRILVSLPAARKEQVPIGSRLLVSRAVRNAVLPNAMPD